MSHPLPLVASLIAVLGACATPPAVQPVSSVASRPVRILNGVYQVHYEVQLEPAGEQPGFKKFQVVNDVTQCRSVWIFNVLRDANAHHRYVADAVDKPVAKDLELRAPKTERAVQMVTVGKRRARSVRYAFSENGQALESGYLDLYDDAQKLSFVALSDCAQGKMEEEQRWVAEMLASYKHFSNWVP